MYAIRSYYVDLAAQNLFGAGDHQGSDLFAQLFLGTDGLLFDFIV